MSKYKAILFDMDGTLLPMDMDEFTKGYFHFLAKKLSGFGIESDKLIAAVWEGVSAMVINDGSVTNDKAFWTRFEKITGVSEEIIGDACLEFYSNEFHEAKIFTQDNPLAREAVRIAHEKAPIVALATNPLFPMCGQVTRMSWIGLTPEDFDIVTSYESDSYCKPNPKYFLSVCDRLGVTPDECLMVGNDEYEDMYTASSVGMDCYLITDTSIKSEKHPWDGNSGSFKEFIEMLSEL